MNDDEEQGSYRGRKVEVGGCVWNALEEEEEEDEEEEEIQLGAEEEDKEEEDDEDDYMFPVIEFTYGWKH